MKPLFENLKKKYLKQCPASGRIVGIKSDQKGKLLFMVIGIAAIVWFLIRVVPKPSRATYPCQKTAATIGGTFLLYLFGAISSMMVYDQIRSKFNKKAALAWIGGIALFASVGIGVAQIAKPVFAQDFTNPDGANNPMGEAKGIFPGRVAWVQDFDATGWDEKTGNWWDDKNTNQAEVNTMMTSCLQNFTGEKTDKESWKSLFAFNNKQNGKGSKNYKKGEKILIKLNLNAVGNDNFEAKSQGYPSPHMVFALVSQLIEVAGVSGDDIILSDPSRFISNQIIEKIRGSQNPEFQKVIFEERAARNQPGFQTAQPDSINGLVWFTMPDGSRYRMCFPKSFSEATYIINYSVVRPHRVFGITSVAKNHFGSVYSFELKTFNPKILHAYALWDYATPNKLKDVHCSPVLLGHAITNKKTMLYLADGLYTAENQSMDVRRMSSFNNDWFSSLLMSQDPVALESVVYDFISNETNLISKNPSFNGNQDNQFQECAMANNPPSGTKYDPENDGTGIQSLGIHEHWNNVKERKYSRNLGKKNGIELVSKQL